MTAEARQLMEALRDLLGRSGDELPEVLGELERLRTSALLDHARPSPAEPGPEVLTPGQAAARLGRSVSWVYKNRGGLPVVRFSSGGWGIHAGRLARYIDRRTS